MFRRPRSYGHRSFDEDTNLDQFISRDGDEPIDDTDDARTALLHEEL